MPSSSSKIRALNELYSLCANALDNCWMFIPVYPEVRQLLNVAGLRLAPIELKSIVGYNDYPWDGEEKVRGFPCREWIVINFPFPSGVFKLVVC